MAGTLRRINNPTIMILLAACDLHIIWDWQGTEMPSLMTNILLPIRALSLVRFDIPSIIVVQDRLLLTIAIEVSVFLGATTPSLPSRLAVRYWFQLQTGNILDAFVAVHKNSAYNQKDWVPSVWSNHVDVLYILGFCGGYSLSSPDVDGFTTQASLGLWEGWYRYRL